MNNYYLRLDRYNFVQDTGFDDASMEASDNGEWVKHEDVRTLEAKLEAVGRIYNHHTVIWEDGTELPEDQLLDIFKGIGAILSETERKGEES